MPQTTEDFRKLFNRKLLELANQKGRTSGLLSPERFHYIVNRLQELQATAAQKKSAEDYRLTTKFVLFETTVGDEPTTYLKDRATLKYHVSMDRIFDAIRTQHLLTGHGARDITNGKLKETLAKITKEVIQLYVDLCETCVPKKRKVHKSLFVKPIISNLITSRCQVDLVDIQSQPDGCFKWICV